MECIRQEHSIVMKSERFIMELRKENAILVSPEPIKHPCSRVDKIAFIDMGEARSVNNLKWLRNVQSPKKAGQK